CRTSELSGTWYFALPLRAVPPGARSNALSAKTSASALKGRSCCRKYYPPIGNRTSHQRDGRAARPRRRSLSRLRRVVNAAERKKLVARSTKRRDSFLIPDPGRPIA